MDQRILKFLTKEKVCALSVCMPDGSCHSAAMHFTYHDGVIYMGTHAASRKISGLSTGKVKASIVVGFSEQEWTTAQLDGEVEKIDAQPTKDIILAKYPEDEKQFDATTIFLKFTPTWYRYTDYKTQPPTFIES